MATYISHSPAETEALGEAWGRAAQSGWVIALSGDLGAGKTQLVKGLARGLGSPDRVHSPSFALLNVYAGGRLPLFHLDLYRLDTLEQFAAAGLEEYLRPAGVTVIEWAERLFSVQSPGSSVECRVSSVETPLRRVPLVTRPSPLATRPSPRNTQHALHWVHFELLSETERRITYEDPGT